MSSRSKNFSLGLEDALKRGTNEVFWVLVTLFLQIFGAVLLKNASEYDSFLSLMCLVLIGTAFGVNFMRFLIWGWIHKNYDLGRSYPLVALFYPMILIVSLLQGETELKVTKIVGTAIIVFGVAMLTLNNKKNA